MFGISFAAIVAIAMIAGLSGQIPFVAADEHETELKAILTDVDGNELGEAKYELEDESSELKVELEGFTADSVFDISIAGTTVGMIATDSEGNGEAKWEPSPIAVVAEDSITVGALAGTFTAESDDDEEPKVEICHKDKKTLSVSADDVDEHLEHGDVLGACVE